MGMALFTVEEKAGIDANPEYHRHRAVPELAPT